MSARTFVGLARRLLDRGFNPFSPSARDELLGRSEAVQLLQERPWEGRDEFESLLSVLRVLVLGDEHSRAQREPEVVATFPRNLRTNVRRTAPVVRELLAAARREVLVVGYTLNDSDFVADLARAAGRGVDVVVVADREQGSVRALTGIWPTGVGVPRCYVNAPAASGSEMASMHSKLLVVDGAEALVTSANFTWLGHNENIEFGIRLRGPPAASARDFFMRLLAAGVLVSASVS